AFLRNDLHSAGLVEPLNQVIGGLKEIMRTNHILRLQQSQCGIEAGFVWSDLLTDLERVSGHCSNIAGCIIDMAMGNLNLHESFHEVKKDNAEYQAQLDAFAGKYALMRL
ncbi:MAG: Na/Pi cotransporter family protein, partial [Lachnospiraceae bacterium]|nr:Na/Pi cotransporter family protein [Lachnospiraceae bacterium]